MVTVAAAVQAEASKSEARRRAILAVAREVFLAEGYAAASMSGIAARLGGSKGTLYNYFRSKEELFAAFMIEACEGPANAIFNRLPEMGEDLRAALNEFGAAFLAFVLSETAMAVHRLVVAESGRFPELGRIFYETGPRMGETKLGEFMAEAMKRGRLKPGDAVETGRWFKSLVLSDIYSRRLWGVIGALSEQQVRTHVSQAVEIFLAAFAPETDA